MRKVLSIIGITLCNVFLISCSNDDEIYNNFSYNAKGIDSVAMPSQINLGQSINITLHTTRLNNCQQFQTIGYEPVGNSTTVIAWFLEYDNVECGAEQVFSKNIKRQPVEPGIYHFKFWAGQDEETQEDIFITRDIVVE